MNNSREKFEAWLHEFDEAGLVRDCDIVITEWMQATWSAARKIDADRIAELEAKLNVDFPLLVKLFDNIDKLQAREKVLVEALKSAKPVYATAKNTKAVKTGHELGGYVKYYLVSPHILHNALANVRGE